MNTLAHVLLALSAGAAWGCASRSSVEPSAPSPITQLDGDRVNALLPYMVDRKGAEPQYRVTDVPGQKFVVRETTQAFTFDVWIGANGHPVMPPGAGGSTSSLKRPTLHHGSFTVSCNSACQRATSDESCQQQGCQPIVSSACGCTPPDCPGCVPLWCDSLVQGALAGTLIM